MAGSALDNHPQDNLAPVAELGFRDDDTAKDHRNAYYLIHIFMIGADSTDRLVAK